MTIGIFQKGVYFNGDLHWYVGASRFNQNFSNFSIAKADIGYAFSVTNRLAMLLESSGGFHLGDKSTNFWILLSVVIPTILSITFHPSTAMILFR